MALFVLGEDVLGEYRLLVFMEEVSMDGDTSCVQVYIVNKPPVRVLWGKCYISEECMGGMLYLA